MQKDSVDTTNIHVPQDARIAIVTAQFNKEVTDALQQGAMKALTEQGVETDRISVFEVPGSVELPLAAAACAKSEKFSAIICLGAVIRGETDHYNHVARMAADGIEHVNVTYAVPTMFGVLTCDTQEQAQARSKDNQSNSGYQAAIGALRMIHTLQAIKNG